MINLLKVYYKNSNNVCICVWYLYTKIYILWDMKKKMYVHTIKVNPKFVLETKWRYQISSLESQSAGVECWNWLFWLESLCFRAWGPVPKSCVEIPVWIVLTVFFYPTNHHHDELISGVNSTSCTVILEECFSLCGKVYSSLRFSTHQNPFHSTLRSCYSLLHLV